MISPEELRRLAEEATPGDRHRIDDWVIGANSKILGSFYRTSDVALAAALDAATILALLAERAALVRVAEAAIIIHDGAIHAIKSYFTDKEWRAFTDALAALRAIQEKPDAPQPKEI